MLGVPNILFVYAIFFGADYECGLHLSQLIR